MNDALSRAARLARPAVVPGGAAALKQTHSNSKKNWPTNWENNEPNAPELPPLGHPGDVQTVKDENLAVKVRQSVSFDQVALEDAPEITAPPTKRKIELPPKPVKTVVVGNGEKEVLNTQTPQKEKVMNPPSATHVARSQPSRSQVAAEETPPDPRRPVDLNIPEELAPSSPIPTELNPEYERIDLPSKFYPYEFKALNIRRLTVRDMVLLNRARKSGNNFSVLADVFDATIDQNIRLLCGPDFQYVLYWHRLNSFSKTPFRMYYTTKYGNRNEYTINKSNLKVEPLKLDEEEFQNLVSQNPFQIPTVSDAEILLTGKLTEDQYWAFERAQYLAPDTSLPLSKQSQDRIARLEAGGIEMLENIREFREKVGNFGVVEKVWITDYKFNPETYLANLRKSLDEVKKQDNELSQEVADGLEKELLALEEKYTSGQAIGPEEEEVTMNFSAWDMFPEL